MDFRLFSYVCYILSFGLELGSFICIVLKHKSVCIQASEIALPISIYFFLIGWVLLPDLLFVILTCKCFGLPKVGSEPRAIMYNLLAFPVTLAAGASVVFIAFFKKCENPDRILILIGGVFALVAGIFHLVNGVLCHKHLEPEERNWREKRKQQLQNQSGKS